MNHDFKIPISVIRSPQFHLQNCHHHLVPDCLQPIALTFLNVFILFTFCNCLVRYLSQSISIFRHNTRNNSHLQHLETSFLSAEHKVYKSMKVLWRCCEDVVRLFFKAETVMSRVRAVIWMLCLIHVTIMVDSNVCFIFTLYLISFNCMQSSFSSPH
jgi:hypothetical protein